jgi:hypothetical protein
LPPASTRCRPLIDGTLIACLALASLYAVASVGLAPRDPAAGVAVVFAPWTSQEDALARGVAAGGRFVRYGAFPFVVVIVPEAADYQSRIRRDGALLLADPQALAACPPLVPADKSPVAKS